MSRYDRWGHEGAPSDADMRRINADITRVMSDVVLRDARHDPTQRPGVIPEGPGTASRPGTGWVDSAPLVGSVPYQDAIQRVADALEPHSPEWLVRQAKAKLSAEQWEELKRMVAAKPELEWIEPLLERVEGPQ